MNLYQQFTEVFREMARRWRDLPLSINLWLQRLHTPIDMGLPTGSPYPWCPRCRTAWPCPEMSQLTAEYNRLIAQK